MAKQVAAKHLILLPLFLLVSILQQAIETHFLAILISLSISHCSCHIGHIVLATGRDNLLLGRPCSRRVPLASPCNHCAFHVRLPLNAFQCWMFARDLTICAFPRNHCAFHVRLPFNAFHMRMPFNVSMFARDLTRWAFPCNHFAFHMNSPSLPKARILLWILPLFSDVCKRSDDFSMSARDLIIFNVCKRFDNFLMSARDQIISLCLQEIW